MIERIIRLDINKAQRYHETNASDGGKHRRRLEDLAGLFRCRRISLLVCLAFMTHKGRRKEQDFEDHPRFEPIAIAVLPPTDDSTIIRLRRDHSTAPLPTQDYRCLNPDSASAAIDRDTMRLGLDLYYGFHTIVRKKIERVRTQLLAM